MKGKHPTTAAGSITRLAILIICATFLSTFKGSPPAARAQADDLAPSAVLFAENFNSVSIPVLPAGWNTAQTNSGSNFRTVAANTANASISVFASNPATPGTSELVSPSIPIGDRPVRLTFRHIFVTEPTAGYDGGVLEISIGGSAFQDILTAGGSFLAGGYVQTIGADATGNTLIGRQAG